MLTTRRIDDKEKKIRRHKSLILFGEDPLLERKLVSVRGMSKLLVSERVRAIFSASKEDTSEGCLRCALYF